MKRHAAIASVVVASCTTPDASQEPFAEVMDVVSIVASSGEGFDLFDAIFVRTLSDGRLAVLNAGSHEVLIFSPEGELERRFGGEGEGPGEFARRAAFMGVLPGDSIVVTDWMQRGAVFTAVGSLARTFDLDGAPDGGLWYAFPNGITADRLLIGSLGLEPTSQGPGAVRVAITVVVHDSSGRLLHVVERPEIYSEFYVLDDGGTLRFSTPPPMTHGRSAAGPGGFLMARGTSRDVIRFGSDGVVRGVIQLPEGPPLSNSKIESLRNAWVDEATSEAGRSLRRRASDEAPPPTEPHVVGDVWIDLLDRIWIREANLEANPLARWLVHEEDALLGYVDLPAELDVREIGSDYVLGVMRDELDVETIVRVRLDIS